MPIGKQPKDECPHCGCSLHVAVETWSKVIRRGSSFLGLHQPPFLFFCPRTDTGRQSTRCGGSTCPVEERSGDSAETLSRGGEGGSLVQAEAGVQPPEPQRAVCPARWALPVRGQGCPLSGLLSCWLWAVGITKGQAGPFCSNVLKKCEPFPRPPARVTPGAACGPPMLPRPARGSGIWWVLGAPGRGAGRADPPAS